MKKNSLRIAALLVGLTGSAVALAIPSYQYAGNWDVYGGPYYQPAPSIYTGQQVAALLFGGLYSDYAISTVDATVANINHKAWVDTYGVLGDGTEVAENVAADDGDGLYNILGDQSAYVNDQLFNLKRFNYAFLRIDDNQVPEPVSLALVGLGLFGIGAVRRRSKV